MTKFLSQSPSNSTDQCDAGGQRKALHQILTASTLKWKESEADEANSEQVTMIYSPHPCSCPELEFRGIKVFSGVNDLFFHIFQRRQICKYRGIHCELSTEPILPSLSDDVPLLS